MKSIDSALRFVLGFFTPVAVEFVMLCVMLQFYCGPKYLFNMLLTLGLYTYFSKSFSHTRRIQIRDKKEIEKKAEFTLNESILNYETVKAFTNEKLEQDRYSKILEKVRKTSMVVQTSLG